MNTDLSRADLGTLAEPLPIKPPRVVANLCNSSSCPTIYQNDSGTLVVQGYVVPAGIPGVEVPSGEALVEIPAALLAEALRNIS
jgi:hypothetical protein